MKRTPLRPGKPPRRKKPMPRGKPASPSRWWTSLPAENRERRERTRGDIVYGEYHAWIGEQPCLLAGRHECVGVVKGHHLKRVGSGGEDLGNEVPACVQLHDMLHKSEERVEERYALDLKVEARRYLDASPFAEAA